MKLASMVAAAGLLLGSVAQGQQGSEATYKAMVKRVKAGDLTVDFRAMRMACMATPACQPRSTKAELTGLVTSDHHQGVAVGERLLEQGYVNVEVHATVAAHYQALGTPEDLTKAKFHQSVFTALVKSIADSGSGRSTDTAFEVISDREEYVLLASLGLPYTGPSIRSMTAMSANGHKYNRWQINNKGIALTIYFNVDAFQAKSVVGDE